MQRNIGGLSEFYLQRRPKGYKKLREGKSTGKVEQVGEN